MSFPITITNLPMLPHYKSHSKEYQRIQNKLWKLGHTMSNGIIFKEKPNKRICPKCKILKEINEFPKYLVKYNQYTCKTCWSKINKKQHYDRRIETLKKIDPDLKCVRCGCTDWRFLEINHKFGGGRKEQRERKGIDLTNAILFYGRSTEDLELLCRPCNHIHALELKFDEKIPLKVIWGGV